MPNTLDRLVIKMLSLIGIRGSLRLLLKRSLEISIDCCHLSIFVRTKSSIYNDKLHTEFGLINSIIVDV